MKDEFKNKLLTLINERVYYGCDVLKVTNIKRGIHLDNIDRLYYDYIINMIDYLIKQLIEIKKIIDRSNENGKKL